MLGLRFFKNTQIDLWQGDPKLFSVDLLCNAGSIKDSLDFDAAYSLKKRHVAFTVSATINAQTLLAHFKTFLSSKPATQKTTGAFSRVTFIAENDDVYDSLQKALFELYEDDLNED